MLVEYLLIENKKMKIFVFDTETTGFIDKKESDLEKQPHIIQFAGILWEIIDGKWKEISRINEFVKPPINIPYWSSQVHHIYDIDVMQEQNFMQKVELFLPFINESDAIVGHNIEYDEWMFMLEMKRLWREYDYHPKQSICTMYGSRDFCQLPRKIESSPWFKLPKLWELYKTLFWEYFVWAHDAMVDVEATVKSFVELVNKKIIVLEKKEDSMMSLF